jgi:hypothetical protein
LRRVGLVLVAIAFLGSVAALITYVRLLAGPISLAFLADPLARSLDDDLGGLRAKIGGVDLVLNNGRRVEFALKTVELREADGDLVAAAPTAVVSLSQRALLSGRLAPERITVTAPRLNVMQADDGLLSLAFTAPQTAPVPPATTPAPARIAHPAAADDGSQLRRFDLIKALASASERARRRADTSSYLREIELADARVVIDSRQRKSIWRVPNLRLDLDHKRTRSFMSGAATVASLAGPWTVSFRTIETAGSDTLEIGLSIRDLIPRALARALPAFAPLDGFDLPVSGDASVVVAKTGEVRRGTFDLVLAAGRLYTPWLGSTPIAIDAGQTQIVYDAAARRIDVPALKIAWGASRLSLTGQIVEQTGPDRRRSYTIAFDGAEGIFSGDADGRDAKPVDDFVVRAQWTPDDSRIQLDRFEVKVGGSAMTAQGDAVDIIGTPRARLEGRIGTMSLATFRALWPRALAEAARTQVSQAVTKGQIQGGTFLLATSDAPPAPPGVVAPGAADAGRPGQPRMSLALETSGIETRLGDFPAPLEIPRALLRIEGGNVEIAAPDAAIVVAEGKRIPIKALRFQSADAFAAQATGEISARVTSPIGPVAELLDREPLQMLRASGIAAAGVDGKIDAQLKATWPLSPKVTSHDVQFEAKGRLTDGRIRQAIAGYDVTGASIAFDLSDRAIDVKGDALVRGVPAKLAWHTIPGGERAPVRLTMSLDNADRNQLGLDINDIVQGEVPVEITIARDQRGENQTRMRCDLTKAELTLDTLAWRKASGRPASFQFDLAKGDKGRTELQNAKVLGDDIAFEGWLALGADNKLREFAFPEFSLNVVSRLDVQGKLRQDNVWDVRAKGATFDGRDMFRQLFNLGQTDRQAPATKTGLDLSAEVDTVLGFSDTSIKGVRVKMQRRQDRVTELDVRATLDGGKPFAAVIRPEPNQPRRLLAEGLDAGQVFKLVGFYPNAIGGVMNLEVNLDAKGTAAEKVGTLWARDFAVLGDPVLNEVYSSGDSGGPAIKSGQTGRQRIVRQQFDIDRMAMPFSIGNGQFVITDGAIRGPLIGLQLRGRVDFRSNTLNLGGTYVPASGLNSAIGAILGPITGGLRGEGLLGLTFVAQGPISNPQVIVNPLSAVAPGIFRSLFEMAPENPSILPGERAKPKSRGDATRSSSAPASGQGAPAAAVPPVQKPADAVSGWSAQTRGKQAQPAMQWPQQQ